MMSTSAAAELQARNQLIGMFVALCCLDLVLLILARDLWAMGRLLFTIVVMYLVLKGYRWAKWLLIGILSCVAVALLALLIVLGTQLMLILSLGSVAMVGLSMVIIVFMMRSEALNGYLHQQRSQNTSSF